MYVYCMCVVLLFYIACVLYFGCVLYIVCYMPPASLHKNEKFGTMIVQARSHWLGWSGFNLTTFITIHTTLI